MSELLATSDALRRHCESQEKVIAQTKKELDELRWKFDFWVRPDRIAMMAGHYKSAILDLSSRELSRVDTDLGFLLVTCEKAEPYLTGYKVTLTIGNPLNMDFNGFHLTTKWGTRLPGVGEHKEQDEWAKGLRSRRQSHPERLLRGHWTRVEVVLPETSPSQIAHFAVEIEPDRVSLATAR